MNNYKTFSRGIFTLKNFAPLRLCVFALIFSFNLHAQTLAPGAPGKDAQWATAGKQGVGTSANLESKVWFTLAQGVMTEVYYPDVTVANVHKLEFVVVNPTTRKVETETADANHNIRVLRKDSLSFQQINTAKSKEWKITKTYTIDVERNSVLIDVSFQGEGVRDLYLYYDPSLNNSGMYDTAWSESNVLYSQDGDKASALIGFETDASSGFLGTSDGLTELRNNTNLKFSEYHKAENGNVVQFARVSPDLIFADAEPEKTSVKATVILSFGKTTEEALKNAKASSTKGFKKTLAEYEKGWSDYIKTLRKVEPKYQAQFNMAAMQLKAHEDKTVRGANIASLSVPWGGGANANENNIGGYHLIWSRDLYQVATAFMALGDKDAAIRALDFLFKVQQKPDGSFPQNSYLDGKPFWGSLQLDEVAFPLILAYQLGRNDKATYENHVKKAADFIVKNGPITPQERWEEEAGYSPSTIAAEIAGLVCAAEIARKNGDSTSADLYLKTADEWQSNIEKWTVTKTGKYSKEPYYLRITQGKPDSGEKLELNNGAGFFDERDIVDAGFLELVRLGIKSPDDSVIQNSLKVIDEVIRVKTPNGDAFYRYNNDGYGEMDDGRRWNWDGKYTGKGRLWALLSGERGQYEIARHRFFYPNQEITFENGSYLIKYDNPKSLRKGEYLSDLNFAKFRLDAMLAFANDGLMIPEQIWDKADVPKNIDKQFIPELKFGEGTGSATPLAWSMAQFIRLAVNLQAGKNLDTPDVVYDRYVLKSRQSSVDSGQLKENDEITEIPIAFKVGVKDIDKFFQNSEIPKQKDSCEIARKYLAKDVGMFGSKEVGKKSPIIFQRPNDKISTSIFTYSGVAENVEVVGDFTDWKPCRLRLIDSDSENFKILFLNFPNTVRVEYKLVVDGKWINDPLNPNKVDNGVGGENSFFTMPDYKPTNLDDGETPKLEAIEIESKIYGKRIIQVYAPKSELSAVADGLTSISKNADKNSNFSNNKLQPPVAAGGSDLPTIYLQDGSDYINRAKAVQIQQNLVKANKIKPFIMVFIDYKDRNKEYWANNDYAKFVAAEVVPAIDAKYKTVKSADGRAIMGASLGGITSVHAALKYPEIFGRVGGQSSSFWVDNERVVKDLEKLDASKTKFKFYFDDGSLEGVEDSRKVVKLLKDKGFDVIYVEGEAGHNWTAWRDRLADAFTAIWK